MATKRTVSVAAAAFMSCASGVASATTVSQTRTSGPTAKPFNATQSYLGFNTANFAALGIPAGSVLTGVSDKITDSLSSSIVLGAHLSGPATVSGAARDNATKTLAGVLTVMVTTTGNAVAAALPANEFTVALSNGTDSATAAATPGMLAAFETNSVTAGITDAITAVTLGVTGPGFVIVPEPGSTATGTVTDVLTYTFTPATTPVPEPATLSLVGSGFVGLGLARLARRRRKR